MEGISFLAVGLVLGSRGLGLFPEDLVSALRVVVLFGMAWIGLVFGVQIELRIIRHLAGFLAAGGRLPDAAFPRRPGRRRRPVHGDAHRPRAGTWCHRHGELPSLARRACAGTADRRPGRDARLEARHGLHGHPGGGAFCRGRRRRQPSGGGKGGPVPTVHLIVMMLAVGSLVGYGLVVLIRGVREHIQLLTLAAGSMCLVAGATSVLGLSALPAAACAGAVLVNRSIFPHRMLRVAHAWERPMLVALLVLVGASWDGAAFALPVFVLLTVVRALGAWAGGEFLGRVVSRFSGWPRLNRLGWGLLPQGELAMGLLVAILSFFPNTNGFLEAVVAALVVNNLVGGYWMRRRVFGAERERARV